MKILAISGSVRKTSTNTTFLKTLKEFAPPGIEISLYDNLNLLPIFSPDEEGEKTPDIVHELMKAIAMNDTIIISSPEYVRTIPGGLKNAIDWMVSRYEIIDKPIALAHASHRGDDMLHSLRLVLSTVSNNFLEDIFLRINLLGKTQEEVEALLHLPKYESQIRSFLQDLQMAVFQNT